MKRKPDNIVIKPPRVVYAKPLADYSQRLARRTGANEKLVASKLSVRELGESCQESST